MLKPAFSLPWVSAEGLVTLQSSGQSVRVCFDGSGIGRWEFGRRVAHYPWSVVRDLDIEVPYSPRRTVFALTLWDMISPKSAKFSADVIEIRFTAGFEMVEWTLEPSRTFNWRIQFILDDLMRLLERDYSPLGVPGVLDQAVETVAPRIRRHSRLLLYTDLLGLDRFIGGHTAFDAQLRIVIAAGRDS